MDFRALLSALVAEDVRFILVGGVAAVIQGVSVHTFDVDVVHARDPENVGRLMSALRGIDARYREHASKQMEPRAADLELTGHYLLSTRLGPLDLLGSVTGGRTYDELIERSPLRDLGQGLRVNVLELEVLVEIKEALGREKDRAQLGDYRSTLEERRKRGPGLGD